MSLDLYRTQVTLLTVPKPYTRFPCPSRPSYTHQLASRSQYVSRLSFRQTYGADIATDEHPKDLAALPWSSVGYLRTPSTLAYSSINFPAPFPHSSDLPSLECTCRSCGLASHDLTRKNENASSVPAAFDGFRQLASSFTSWLTEHGI